MWTTHRNIAINAPADPMFVNLPTSRCILAARATCQCCMGWNRRSWLARWRKISTRQSPAWRFSRRQRRPADNGLRASWSCKYYHDGARFWKHERLWVWCQLFCFWRGAVVRRWLVGWKCRNSSALPISIKQTDWHSRTTDDDKYRHPCSATN